MGKPIKHGKQTWKGLYGQFNNEAVGAHFIGKFAYCASVLQPCKSLPKKQNFNQWRLVANLRNWQIGQVSY